MFLIDCETSLILTWSPDYVISVAMQKKKFRITDTKLYISVVTLLT